MEECRMENVHWALVYLKRTWLFYNDNVRGEALSNNVFLRRSVAQLEEGLVCACAINRGTWFDSFRPTKLSITPVLGIRLYSEE